MGLLLKQTNKIKKTNQHSLLCTHCNDHKKRKQIPVLLNQPIKLANPSILLIVFIPLLLHQELRGAIIVVFQLYYLQYNRLPSSLV